ncbi:SAM-dependent methyltransferase [Halobacteriales archaeon QS_4_70_19]|nr:MAG: SAM-dependent methyltransferase [Halobacteriales archaeon QS_4_70_19]
MKGREWYQSDDVADAYEDKRFSNGGRLIDDREKEAVLDALGNVEGKRVLEVACGTGRFTSLLADHGADIIGLDISPAMLRQGREKARSVDVDEHLEFMRADAARLPFPDDYFDAVLAMRFFHLADRPASFLSEMARVSRDQVFFDTFKRFSFRSIYNFALPMGSRLYSSGEVERLLTGAGLQLEGTDHDFVFPYGFYRQVPGEVARPFRETDAALVRTPIGRLLASVSYWDARVS